jgi:hypothetical protein
MKSQFTLRDLLWLVSLSPSQWAGGLTTTRPSISTTPTFASVGTRGQITDTTADSAKAEELGPRKSQQTAKVPAIAFAPLQSRLR